MSVEWMNPYFLAEIALLLIALLGLSWPLGLYIAQVFAGKRNGLTMVFGPLERWIYRLANIHPEEGMNWKLYAKSVLGFSLASILLLYALLRLQGVLPMHTGGLPGVSPALAFNIAISFVTGTNWQAYSGEQSLTLFSQMVGLAVQNFLAVGVSLAVLMAVLRGFTARNVATLGNFWSDLVRGVLYILLPLSLLLALAFVAQGVPQNFTAHVDATTLEGGSQTIAMGPVASQVAIRQLGSGGGFFNANSAHPFENPTALTHFLGLLFMLLLPVALCHSLGVMAGDRRQGWSILAAMFILFTSLSVIAVSAEQGGGAFTDGIETAAAAGQSGGNMEGKEVRIGAAHGAFWAATATATATGSSAASHASLMPLTQLVALAQMQMGEAAPGGVGSGLYVMLIFVLLTVFVAGLMVGRTPEYLGKKIQAFEMKMVGIAILLPPLIVLALTAIAAHAHAGRAAVMNPGAAGFTEILYAFTSAAHNNGSALAGLQANTLFYNVLLGLAMLAGRFGVMLSVLAIAGSLARKNPVPATAGTLPTHGLLFITMLVVFVMVIGVLTFVPSLALGPIASHLMVGG